VIRAIDHVQRRALSEPFNDRREQREVGESIASSLEEQQRQRDAREMLGARDTRCPAGWSGKPRNARPLTPSSGVPAAARDVMRPPMDSRRR